ncbi:MAG: helix-turn-helix transcriptional regulator, partial [Fidelibacterota bacterium]
MGIEERQQREKQERMAAILAAAKQLFARKGYQETSMSDIAEACELGKATLYYYFPTKEDIYQEIILTTTREYHESLEASIRDLDQIGELVE